MTTAEIVRTARQEWGWSQKRLAKEANISHQAVSRIESEECTSMTTKTAVQIARALGISLDFLLCRDG